MLLYLIQCLDKKSLHFDWMRSEMVSRRDCPRRDFEGNTLAITGLIFGGVKKDFPAYYISSASLLERLSLI